MERGNIEGLAHTSVRALLQLVPLVGGAAAEVLGHVWTAPSVRRLKSFCEHFERRLAENAVDMDELRERVARSEATQVLIADVVAAVTRTTSEEQRAQLATLLAKSIDSTDRDIANAAFVLRCWQELDDVEKLILVGLKEKWFDNENRTTHHVDVFGVDYFGANDHYTRMAKDDLHIRRISHMMQLGLIRPINDEKWRNRQLGYQFINFIPSSTGESLLYLLTE